MILRAEKIGVPWTKKCRLREASYRRANRVIGKPTGECTKSATKLPRLLPVIPRLRKGNLNWEAALEVEVAAYAMQEFGPMLERKEISASPELPLLKKPNC